jgi:DNA-directed RNA polymerase specialized sigma24 family protein
LQRRLHLDDIRQELLLQAWRRRPGFDAVRGSEQGFITRVIGNAAADLIAREAAPRRGGLSPSVPLDEPVADDEGEETCTLADTLGPDAALWPGAEARPDVDELRIDVRRAIARLPREDQRLCAGLTRRSVTDLARAQDCSRAAIYDRIDEIRRAFERLGLAGYVRADPDSSRSRPVDRSRGARCRALA